MRDKDGYKVAFMEDGVIIACRSQQGLKRGIRTHKRYNGQMKSWFSKEPNNYKQIWEAFSNDRS